MKVTPAEYASKGRSASSTEWRPVSGSCHPMQYVPHISVHQTSSSVIDSYTRQFSLPHKQTKKGAVLQEMKKLMHLETNEGSKDLVVENDTASPTTECVTGCKQLFSTYPLKGMLLQRCSEDENAESCAASPPSISSIEEQVICGSMDMSHAGDSAIDQILQRRRYAGFGLLSMGQWTRGSTLEGEETDTETDNEEDLEESDTEYDMGYCTTARYGITENEVIMAILCL